MKIRIAAVVTAFMLGVAPISSAMALSDSARTTLYRFNDVETTGALGIHDSPFQAACPMSSASEGNANQQNVPVKQYGQTAGGTRC